MKIRPSNSEKGYALVLVMFFGCISLLVLGGALNSSSTAARILERQKEMTRSSTAAEAATEKVVASIVRDFYRGSETLVQSELSNYQLLVPSAAEDPYWADFQFSNGAGVDNRTGVTQLSSVLYTNLNSQYRGLKGYVSDYEVYSEAATVGSPLEMGSAVRQFLQLARVPIFQFGFFYADDLEVHPGSTFLVYGRVHGNGNFYSQTTALTMYYGDVTTAGRFISGKKAGDPVARASGTPYYRGLHEGGTCSFTLPLGTNQSPASLHRIIEVPPTGELISSDIGRERFYNKADLIVLVSNNTVVAKSGSYNNFSITIPWSLIGETNNLSDAVNGKGKGAGKSKGRGKGRPPAPPPTTNYPGVIDTNYTFFNKRENRTINVTELDVEILLVQYTNLTTLLGRAPRTIYIGDFRTQTASSQPGVRIINAERIPSAGLTVVTPHPLYIWGDFNAPSNHFGTTNTTLAYPAALVGDAITFLSSRWDDTNAGGALSARTASNTMVNAAILTGHVPTGAGVYSGGAENLIRLLENWNSKFLIFNGSQVELFHSTVATAPWGGFDVFNSPIRVWSFDQNFLQLSKLPPSTPQLRAVFRTRWESLAAAP